MRPPGRPLELLAEDENPALGLRPSGGSSNRTAHRPRRWTGRWRRSSGSGCGRRSRRHLLCLQERLEGGGTRRLGPPRFPETNHVRMNTETDRKLLLAFSEHDANTLDTFAGEV